MPSFAEVGEKYDFPKGEEEILAWWEANDTFRKSVELSKGRPRWSFYDGPPFATGLPHYGHILAGTIKDIVCRYAHQTGHYVERRFGWDCHGLPVEFEIDKKLGITGREDVLPNPAPHSLWIGHQAGEAVRHAAVVPNGRTTFGCASGV